MSRYEKDNILLSSGEVIQDVISRGIKYLKQIK